MLHPAIKPYAHGLLDVGDGHQIYWEQCGNPQGQPALFLHGGPGGGCTAQARRLFDPRRYRIVLFDQRGCGRSTPHASTQANDCEHLVRDMERLRGHLQIDQWLLCGGSWGATLALAYTQLHRQRVQALVLRSVFTGQTHELNWLYRPGGASQVFPEAWQAFASALGPVAPDDLLPSYAQRLSDADPVRQQHAALAWCAWESAIGSLDAGAAAQPPDPRQCLAMARISAHIVVNDPMLRRAGFIWPAHYLAGIPGIIVQGRFDMVSPSATAWQLHAQWPGSVLRMVNDAGHVSSDAALLKALINALDDMEVVCLL